MDTLQKPKIIHIPPTKEILKDGDFYDVFYGVIYGLRKDCFGQEFIIAKKFSNENITHKKFL